MWRLLLDFSIMLLNLVLDKSFPKLELIIEKQHLRQNLESIKGFNGVLSLPNLKVLTKDEVNKEYEKIGFVPFEISIRD